MRFVLRGDHPGIFASYNVRSGPKLEKIREVRFAKDEPTEISNQEVEHLKGEIANGVLVEFDEEAEVVEKVRRKPDKPEDAEDKK